MKGKFGKHHNGIRTADLVAIAAVTVAVLLILLQFITSNVSDNVTQSITLQYCRELNAQMSSHVSSTLDYYFHELNIEYDALRYVDNLDEEKLESIISDIQEHTDITYLAFADEDGYIYEDDGSYLGTMRVPMLGKLLSGEKRVITDNMTVGNESYIMIGTSFDEPVLMSDKTITMALLGMDHDDLSDHIVMESDYSGSFASIIHVDGSFVVKNPSEPFSGLNIFSIIEKNYTVTDEELSALKSSISSGRNYIFNAVGNTDEDSVYMYFAPIEGTEWYISNTLPVSFIKSNIVDFRNSVIKVSIVFAMLLVLVAAIIIGQQMSSSKKLRKSQRELENALKIAEEASGAKTSFLFSMSHDIRTPMNAILGYTDIGLRYVDNPEQSRDSYQKIKIAGGHLLNLINDILEMSRIESGKMALNEKPMDIRNTISDVTIMSQSLAVAKSIDFETIIGDIRNPYVYADELHFNEVIINIISNAVKYTPDGGKVRYTVNQTGDVQDGKATYCFEISDNGIGMSEEFQKHLFETFSREENSTISKTEGTGLGLSIVKKIVDMTGGDIKVSSVQGKGSTFTVTIPFKIMDDNAIEEFVSEQQKSSEISSDISFAGKKVLLAEDNELNREIATFILEDAGFEVDTAEDGELAVNAVKEKGTEYYDFILMDIQMPVMNGYEATRKIRELPDGNAVPIIALSANAFEEDKIKSIEEGMNAHVAKPIDINVLLETMHTLMK